MREIGIGEIWIGIGAMDRHHPASRIAVSSTIRGMRIGNEDAIGIGAMDRRHPASRIIISRMLISKMLWGMRIDPHLPCVPS